MMLRCSSYSTAASYDISGLFEDLKIAGNIELYRNAIHAQVRDNKEIKGDIFYFPYGVVIFWGFSEKEEYKYLHALKAFEKQPFKELEIDEFTFCYGSKMKIDEDMITLQNRRSLTKLAVSYGLAQSAKLTNFEETLQKTISQTKKIPETIAKKGKIALSRKEASKKMGEIFLERNFINLHTEVFDTPEFFWDHPELETEYAQTIHYLDVHKRVELLNKRLNVLHELFEILSNELNHQHASRLEWIIIVLIVIEVVMVLLKDLFHLL
jgi:uncharacterized Rmd1/YagE family protein